MSFIQSPQHKLPHYFCLSPVVGSKICQGMHASDTLKKKKKVIFIGFPLIYTKRQGLVNYFIQKPFLHRFLFGCFCALHACFNFRTAYSALSDKIEIEFELPSILCCDQGFLLDQGYSLLLFIIDRIS